MWRLRMERQESVRTEQEMVRMREKMYQMEDIKIRGAGQR